MKLAITYAQDGRSVTSIAEDTDILGLLMSHWRERMGDMVFGTDIKEKKMQSKTFWRISELFNQRHNKKHFSSLTLGLDVIHYLLLTKKVTMFSMVHCAVNTIY